MQKLSYLNKSEINVPGHFDFSFDFPGFRHKDRLPVVIRLKQQELISAGEVKHSKRRRLISA